VQIENNSFFKKNLKLILTLLSIWFFITFIISIFFNNYLNNFEFYGVKLGYFMLNQGLIYFFILIIYIYNKQASKLEDEEFERSEI
jgi:putative solute:sodium symporter small subunit